MGLKFGRLRFLGQLTHSVVNKGFESRHQKRLSMTLSSEEKKMLPYHYLVRS